MQPSLLDAIQKAPDVSASDVDSLIAALKGAGWVTRAQLQCSGVPWSERKFRAVAEASEGAILSGQSGYKLTVESTADEIAHASRWLERQGRSMIARAQQIRLLAHIGGSREIHHFPAIRREVLA